MEVHLETAPGRFLRWGNVPIGTSPQQLADSSPQPAYKGIMLTALKTNTRPLWIGGNINVQANSSAMGGYPLEPGATVVIPCDSPHQIYLVSDDSDQICAWMAV